MMKKIISLLLVVCMLAACCTAFAADLTTEQKADALNLMGLFNGTDKGYELDKHTTREQGVTMLVRLLGKETEAKSGKYTCKFADVYDWAKGIVGYATDNGITKGMSETDFGYGVELTDAMFLTMLLRIVNYTEGDAGGQKADFVWNDPYTVAKNVGMLKEAKADDDFTRGDMVEVVYNTLTVEYKNTDKTVVKQLIADGVVTQAAYDLAQQVATGATTLEAAKAALNAAPGGIGGDSTGTGTGGGNQGNFTPPADPDPGIGGPVELPSESTQEDHETPDMSF